MKRKSTLTIPVLFVFIMTMAILSCDNDDSSDEAYDSQNELFVISTINTFPDKTNFYFTLDNGKTMFPGDKQEIDNKKYEDGQRAFVVFNMLKTPAEGYDYNIRVKQIREIPTKETLLIDKDGVIEEIGDAPVNATYMWITQDKKYLTVEYQYYNSQNSNEAHSLNLVTFSGANASPQVNENDEYMYLEFRHKAHQKNSDLLEEGYVSFKLENIKDLLEGKKGLRIRVNTIYEGPRFYNIDFPEVK